MQTILKIGGLVFSSGLTLSLFGRLFGLTPFGILMAVAALALFEGGAFGWAHLLHKAREAQRVVAATCLVIAVTLSLFSSGAEIILATKLGAEALKALDWEFLTLLSIVAALATNVIGALCFDAMKPETRRSAQKLAFEGRLAEMQFKAQNQIMDAAELDADLRVETRAPALARLISDRALQDTQRAVQTLSTAGRDEQQPAQLPAPVAQAEALPAPAWPTRQTANAAHAVGGGEVLERYQDDDEQPATQTAIGPLPGMGDADLTRYTPGSHLHPTAQFAPTTPAAVEAKTPAPKARAKPGRKPGATKARAKVG